METQAQLGAVGAVLVCVSALVVLVVGLRSAHARRRRLDEALARSQAQVDALDRRVEELTDEVADARTAAQQSADRRRQEREYVITSLGAATTDPWAEDRSLAGRPAGRVLEDQLVDALAGRQDDPGIRGKAVDAVVRTVALAAGVRRALSPDVLDRAVAEAHVARRRSRRVRRREVREARKLIRAVRTQRGHQDAA